MKITLDQLSVIINDVIKQITPSPFRDQAEVRIEEGLYWLNRAASTKPPISTPTDRIIDILSGINNKNKNISTIPKKILEQENILEFLDNNQNEDIEEVNETIIEQNNNDKSTELLLLEIEKLKNKITQISNNNINLEEQKEQKLSNEEFNNMKQNVEKRKQLDKNKSKTKEQCFIVHPSSICPICQGDMKGHPFDYNYINSQGLAYMKRDCKQRLIKDGTTSSKPLKSSDIKGK